MSKGQVHEGIIHVTNRGSVITWDFDVLRHDVVFTVYRLKSPLKVKSPSSTPTPTPTGQTSFNFPTQTGKTAGTGATLGPTTGGQGQVINDLSHGLSFPEKVRLFLFSH